MNMKTKLSIIIFISLMLSIIPLPQIFNIMKPNFILLLVLYIQFYLPKYFNLLFVFFLSLMQDVLMATVIGEHAFALLLTTWFISSRTRRFICFPQSQQMMVMLLLSAIYQSALVLIEMFLGNNYQLMNFIGSIVTTTLMWSCFKMFLDKFLIKNHPLRN